MLQLQSPVSENKTKVKSRGKYFPHDISVYGGGEGVVKKVVEYN